MGMPTKWNRYVLIGAWALLAIVALAPVLLQILARLRRKEPMTRRLRYTLFTRSLCLLLAFMFILGPNEFNTLARADELYSNLDTSDWGIDGTTIEYEYDANGSLIRKTTWDGEIGTGTITEEREYIYNLQNRLAYIIDTDGTPEEEDDEILTEYRYNDAGIRVAKVDYTGATPETTLYLIDSANHTGYAQVIAELTYNKENPVPSTDVPDAIRSYTIGDDVIAQSDNPGTTADTRYLLYDGHGSTRQVTDYDIDGSTDILDSYSYDAYGMILGGNPVAGSSPTTNLLYCGEQFDTNSQNYYLRARWYDPSNGRFNRVDPFAGNTSDPQSLHKYLYCHANPVNAIDPSGMITLLSTLKAISIMSLASAIIGGVLGGGWGLIKGEGFLGKLKGLAVGAITGALRAFISTFISLSLFAMLSYLKFPGAGPIAFGLGAALVTLMEIIIRKGHMEEFDWWLVIASFAISFTLTGLFQHVSGSNADALRVQIAKKIQNMADNKKLVKDLTTGIVPGVFKEHIKKHGIIETVKKARLAYQEALGKYNAEIKQIFTDLITGNLESSITTSTASATVTFFTSFFYEMKEMMTDE
jgi:RHS repeat-associated protein